jgi:hypothetical protein
MMTAASHLGRRFTGFDPVQAIGWINDIRKFFGADDQKFIQVKVVPCRERL